MDESSIQTLVAHHSQRLSEAFACYCAKYKADPQAVEINQLDYEGGTQWWARSKGEDGVYDSPVLIYEMTHGNPMECVG